MKKKKDGTLGEAEVKKLLFSNTYASMDVPTGGVFFVSVPE
jgi:hypothetical protein